MSKRSKPKVFVEIENLFVLTVGRDVLHARGDDTSVRVKHLSAKKVGGDVVNAGSDRAPDRTKRRRRAQVTPRPALRKLLPHAAFGALSLCSAVAASGIAYALGWS